LSTDLTSAAMPVTALTTTLSAWLVVLEVAIALSIDKVSGIVALWDRQ
jgi:hypothetical protein